MTQFKVQTQNTNTVWDEKKRYKVNSVVSYNDVIYQNTTGKNSIPSNLLDWISLNQIVNAIPLTGTEDGNPVTGNIEIKGDTPILFNIFQNDTINGFQNGLFFDNDSPFFCLKSQGIDLFSSLNLTNGALDLITTRESVNVSSANAIDGGLGLLGAEDYSDNLTEFAYPQKIYVDILRGKHISKTTTQINAIVTPQNGETYFNTTLSTLCFYDGASWKRVSHSPM